MNQQFIVSGRPPKSTYETKIVGTVDTNSSPAYTVLQDEASSTISYFGFAPPNTATSAASWQIFKLDTSSGLSKKYAGAGAFNQVWDNRAGLTYA